MALGMNMISKASDAGVRAILKQFPGARLVTLSGNTCTDKKQNTINNLLGRSKHVVAEVNLSRQVVEEVRGGKDVIYFRRTQVIT
jgi:hydroxymethylglutaryl-CoA reductase (NADPH)